MFVILFCTVIVLFITFCYVYSTRHYDYWKKKKIDFIKPIPFFGCMMPNVTFKLTSGDLLVKFYQQIDKDFFGIYVFDRPVLVIKSPQIIKDILLKDFDHFRDRTINSNHQHAVIANGLFFKHGPEWKTIRSKVSPVFTSGKLRIMFNVIMNESELMIDYINQKCIDAPNVEAKEICAKFSTNVIARCAFGVEANSFKDENAEFRKIGRSMFDFRVSTALRQGGNFFLPAVTKLFHINFFEVEVVEKMTKIFMQVLEQRQKMDTLKGSDLIDILLEDYRKNGEEFSPTIAIAQAFQFFLAGFETSSSSISFTLYELAVNPDVQDKLRKEIQEFVNENGQLTYDGLMDLKYLDMVLSEVLRKYPVIPFLDRECLKDYKISGTDLVIEKDTAVYVPLFGLHYDPKYFPNPEKFIPERFADKSKINQDGFYYLPFGEGPRHCIGMRFGQIVSKIGIAQILLNYQLLRNDLTPDRITFEPKAFVTQSTVGIPLKFRKI